MVHLLLGGQRGHAHGPSLFSVAVVIKSFVQSNLGRNGFISAYRLQSIMKGGKGRNLRQELKQSP